MKISWHVSYYLLRDNKLVDVLRPNQQLRPCRAGLLPINTVPSNWHLQLGYNGRDHNISVMTSHETLEKEDRIDWVKNNAVIDSIGNKLGLTNVSKTEFYDVFNEDKI